MKKLFFKLCISIVLISSLATLEAMSIKEALNILGIPEGRPIVEVKQKIGPAYLKLVQEYHLNPTAIGAKDKIELAGKAKQVILKNLEKLEQINAEKRKQMQLQQDVKEKVEGVKVQSEKERLEYDKLRKSQEKQTPEQKKSEKITPIVTKENLKKSWNIKILNNSGEPIKIRIEYADGTKKDQTLGSEGTFSLQGNNNKIKFISYWQDTSFKQWNPWSSAHEMYGIKEKDALTYARKQNPTKNLTYLITVTSSNKFLGKIEQM